ncbi:CPBP family intramembrane metalloprotease [Flaviaesturariibacter aridisoli]|uniref:CPBP family intramembrane metalloprotease n=2 Tax=Flaviaesturariibacter aridisoli TaxID=2545761 RepID=A0A4R4DZR0_9BACT|nr:CPBP family intramembrane metalloprotease [Flaviaesturariibacter aridisoli]
MVTTAKAAYLAAGRKGTIPRRERMQTYLKSRPVIVQLLLFVGMAMGILMIFLVIGGSLLSAVSGISLLEMGNYRSWVPGDPNLLLQLRGMMLLQFAGFFLIPSLLYARFCDKRPGEYLGLRAPFSPLFWVIGIVTLLAAWPFVDLTGVLNRWMIAHSPFQQGVSAMEEQANRTILMMLQGHTIKNLLLNILCIAVTAGVGEELLFRGIIQRLLIRGTRSPWSGILITAFLFSFFHMQFMGFLPRFFLGVILGALYWYSGSLWAAMLAHFLYDALLITIAYFFPATASSDASVFGGLNVLLPAGIAGLALVVFLIKIMERRSRTDFNAIYAEELHGPRPDNDLSF